MVLGYIIPEFPGQTHVWMWREIVHMRESGAEITIFSTRRPSKRDRARHAFAESAQKDTVYLWPRQFVDWFGAMVWAIMTRPLGFARCAGMTVTLPLEKRPAWKALVHLHVPACVLAREVKRRGIEHLHCHSCANTAILAMMVKRLTGVGYSMTLKANIAWWGGVVGWSDGGEIWRSGLYDCDYRAAAGASKAGLPEPPARSGTAGTDRSGHTQMDARSKCGQSRRDATCPHSWAATSKQRA